MNSSRPSTFIILAYSICVLLLPWTTYSSTPVAGAAEQSIASAYDVMAQPLLWQQQDPTLKGKNKSPESLRQTTNDFDDTAVDTPPPQCALPIGVHPPSRRAPSLYKASFLAWTHSL